MSYPSEESSGTKPISADAFPAGFKRYAFFRPAWASFAVYILGAFIFLAGPWHNPDALIGFWPGLGLGLGFAAFIIFKRLTVCYCLSPEELRRRSYLPGGTEAKVNLKQITRIDLRRSLLHRMLDVAHIHIYVEDQETPSLRLFGVSAPKEFKEILLALGAKDTVRRGAWRS